MKRFALVALILIIVVAINLPHGALTEVGISPNILIGVLAALIIAGLVSNQNLGIIALVILAAIAANVPPEIAANIGYDRDIMLAVLIGLVVLPFIARHLS
ncbi:MAG: hypothetical protein HYY48_00810 [Gammaproteobacteria bacterium]|nr:hypothetical protein [Gammaproteobacteria bacterium]